MIYENTTIYALLFFIIISIFNSLSRSLGAMLMWLSIALWIGLGLASLAISSAQAALLIAGLLLYGSGALLFWMLAQASLVGPPYRSFLSAN
jgi:hypothetical protein